MLLATSMVLSSVSVGTFADELIFEPEVSVTTEAGEDEAYFGEEEGDAVVNEQTATDDEAFFSDEVIDETVNDDVVTEDENIEDTANEVVDYAFAEEPADEPIADGNEDIYAAIANDEANYATVIIDDKRADINHAYTGVAETINVAAFTDIMEPIQYAGPNLGDEAVAQIEAGTYAGWSNTAPSIKDVTPGAADHVGTDYYYVHGIDKSDTTKYKNYKVEVTIKPAALTATVSPKTFTYGDTTAMGKTVALTDFTFDGLVNGEKAADVLTLSSAEVKWQAVKVNAAKTVGTADADTYDLTRVAATGLPTVSSTGNYTVTNKVSTVTINKAEVTVTWALAGGVAFKVAYDGKAHAPTATVKSPSGFTAYTVTVDEGATQTKVGKYTSTVTKIANGDTDVTANLTITNPTQEWEITNQIIVVKTANISTYYGDPDPTKNLKYEDLTFGTIDGSGAFKTTDISKSDVKIGTLKFTTNYNQYENLKYDTDAKQYQNKYKVWYESGLTSDKYDFVSYEGEPGVLTVVPVPVALEAEKVIVGVNEEPVDLTDKYTVKNGKAGTEEVKWSAESFNWDVSNKRIKVALATEPEKPSVVDSYPVKFTLTNVNAKDTAIVNYKFGIGTATPTIPTYETMTWTGDDADKYIVTWGDFSVTFKDYEGKYDEKAHGIIVEPETLPAGITVYYMSKEWTGDTAPTAPGEWTTAKADPTTVAKITTLKDASSTNMPTQKEVGKKTVYYYVESNDLSLQTFGYNTITILTGAEGDAKEVEKKIAEAVKRDADGKLDADKVNEAKAAYDALSDAAKKEVSAASKKKLEDALAEVAGDADAKAAKAVEDLIDALPAATEATAADKEAADAAKEAYDKLTDAQKALVPADKVKKMNDVKAAADEAAKMDDAKKAKAVEDAIAALPEADQATAADKAAADAAKEAYDALTDAQKALVPAEAVDKMNAVKAAADEAAEKEAAAKEEVAAFDEKVAAVRETKNGVDGKAAAEKAKEAYDALSPEAKKLLTEEEKTAYEDTQKAYAKNFTFNSGEGVFKVLGNGEVTYFKPLHPENTWFVVPNMVKKNGFVYKVIKVSTKAFMGCVNATKIKIGKNVQVIGEYAFKNTPAMGKLIFLTSKLASGKVQNSFVAGGKNGGAKLTNYVPSGKSSTYDSLFKGEGGMNAKAKFTEED